jgi:hypothetical protein
MKIRGSIIWFVVIATVLIALVLWFGKKQPAETPPTASVVTNAVPPAPTASSPPVSAPVHTNAPMVITTKGADLLESPAQTKEERAIGLLSEYNDIPIVFYGRVEDQFSNAVADATVSFSVRVINGQESTVNRGQVLSDGNGLFTISGYTGQDLSIVPQKAGYVLATTGTFFKYSHLEEHPYVSDPNNPLVIKMWKLQGVEPLVGINKTYKLAYTGAPIFFDFVTGEVVPTGGDLEVIVTRAPGSITQLNHGDWSIELMPVNGGIMESDFQTAQVTFEAPADGYQDSYLVQMNNNNPAWFDNIQQVFFLTSRGSQVYSKFSLDFGINDDPNGTMWFQFKGVANANGSRNWEATAPQ